MAKIVIIGAGTNGLTAAVLLHHDGHEVTVLERDPHPAPPPDDAWDHWARRGVAQFRLPHHYAAGFARTIERELPALASRLVDAGALTWNPIDAVPAAITGGRRAGDEQFDLITGRRPFIESVAAQHALDLGVGVRRGAAVSGLAYAMRGDGTVDIDGVFVDRDRISADLVVDAGGRRSPIAALLRATGSPGPVETRRDAGYVYFARHYRSDGAMPALRGGLLQPYGSISIATLPAERGTWSVVVFARSGDRALAGLRRIDAWERVVKAFPLAAHWIDAEPITDIDVMASIEDRRCDFLVDGRPMAIGVVPLGDAWASTSPSLGRGSTFGVMHAALLRDVLREVPATDHFGLASTFHAASRQWLAPWIDDTTGYDRHRLAEMQAASEEVAHPADADWHLSQQLARAARHDPDLFRRQLGVTQALHRVADVLAEPGIAERAAALDDGASLPGPDRCGLIDLVAQSASRPVTDRPALDRLKDLIAR